MKTQQVKPLPDTPAVIVNVFVKEEHHYHKGAVHLDFHDHFMAHLVSKLKFYLHISKKYCTFGQLENVGVKKKTRSWKETSTEHQHCGIPLKIRTPLLDGIQPNERCFEPEYNFWK